MNEPVTGLELGRLIRVSEQTVRDLARKGIVVRKGRGAYDLAQSVGNYSDHLREMAAGRGGESGINTLTAERARLAREQADTAAQKNAAMRRELVSAAEVERGWVEIVRASRAAILALTSRIRGRLPHLTAADAKVIDGEIRDALATLGNGEGR